jgi:hypothetical protein
VAIMATKRARAATTIPPTQESSYSKAKVPRRDHNAIRKGIVKRELSGSQNSARIIGVSRVAVRIPITHARRVLTAPSRTSPAMMPMMIAIIKITGMRPVKKVIQLNIRSERNRKTPTAIAIPTSLLLSNMNPNFFDNLPLYSCYSLSIDAILDLVAEVVAVRVRVIR